MISILKKELNSFFNASIGYLIVLVFLVLNGLFLWVIPGAFNLLESGYAELDGFFQIAPWVFLFLIPSVTMRLFSEELKTGTIELLLTKPISILQLVLGKYLAGLSLCLIALIPTLTYLVSIYYLSHSTEAIDWGPTLGSYLGLVLLSGAYTSIGVFTSSITENQVVAFILSLILCLFSYVGFDQLAELLSHTGMELSIETLGINYHYKAISRGVIDTRDLIYFASFITLFLCASRLSLQTKKW